MKRILPFLFILGFLYFQGYSQINSSSPAVPFASRTSYDYGIMPTNLPTGGTYGKSQAAADAYTAWKANHTEVCANGTRVKFDAPNTGETVSEGIAYGMLLSAYAGDKPLFDNLWKYYKANSTNGIMNWKINGCSGVLGANGATDAELDAAMALLVAENQWPTATSPYDYANEATTLIEKIRTTEIDPTSKQTVNGNGWGFGSTCRNPSYFSPAYYRQFAVAQSSQASFWNSTVATTQSFLLTNRNATTGLVSNWADNNATANNCNGPNEYGWDACRNPWRMATDVLWYGSATATTAADICTKLSNWMNGWEGSLKGPLSQSAANPSVGTYKNGTFSTYGLALMTMTSAKQTNLNTAYTNTVSLGTGEAYFSATLRTITLFMMTGNFWKPGSAVSASPLVTAAATNVTGTKISLTFNKNMATPAAGSYSGFTLKKNGNTVASAFTAIALNGTTVIDLTLATAAIPGDVFTISYTPGTIQSSDANALATFSNQIVTNAMAGSNTIIANCEDGNTTKLLTFWYSYKAGTSTIVPLSTAANPFTMTLGGANGTDSAAIVTGNLAKPAAPDYESAGMGFTFVEPEANYDLTGATGISFWHKGDAVNFSVMLSTVTPDAGKDYNFAVSAHAAWTLVEVPFASLAQANWVTPTTPWDATKITRLQWQVKDGATRNYSFGIDEVTVMGKVLTLPTPIATVDKTALTTSITTATATHTTAVEGTSNGQYPVGSKATLLAAINAATTVKNNATATQVQVDNAKATLDAALLTFQNSVINLTPVVKTALATSIATATAARTAAVEGTGNGQYPAGSKTTLLTAINAATNVYNNASATQLQVDNAKNTLDAALLTFQNSVIVIAPTNTIIADCEDGNTTKLLTYWYSYKAGSSTITPLSTAANPFTMTLGGANGTDSAAIATGNLVNPAGPAYESAGIGFTFVEPEANYNLTGATGISFWHKGSDVNFSVMLSTVEVDAGKDYSFAVPAHANWTLVEVPFTSLAQANWVNPTTTWDPTKITRLQWQVKDGLARTYSIGIDEVTVMGKVLTLPTPPVTADKTALTTSISTSNTAYSAAVEGTGNGQYPSGSKATLLTAINAATTVKNNASATQTQVDNAKTTLDAALVAFQNKIIVVSLTTLTSTISTANSYYSTSTEGTSAGQYPVGSKATLLNAINAATTVKNAAASSQVQVDNANSTLQTAINTFLQSVNPSVDKSELVAAITNANGIYTNAVEGTGNGQYPVGSKATLLNAINAAQSVNTNSNNQLEVTNATSTLNTAVTTFLNSVNGMNTSTLSAKIAEANTALQLSQGNTGNNPGNYPASAVTALSSAISIAQSVLTNATTQSQITNAVNALQDEIIAYNGSVIPTSVNYSSLEFLIGISQDAISNAVVGTDVGEYPANTWNALFAEIGSANSLITSGIATQDDVDAKRVELQGIYNAFISSVVVSIEENEIAKLQVYLNNSSQTIVISSGKEIANVSISNVLGAVQISRQVEGLSTGIQVSSITDGIYFVSVIFTDGSIETVKVIKK